MPVILPANTGTNMPTNQLALAVGTAQGQEVAGQRNAAFDSHIIDQAIAASQASYNKPSFYEQATAGDAENYRMVQEKEAADNNAQYQRSKDEAQYRLQTDRLASEDETRRENADAHQLSALAKYNTDSTSASAKTQAQQESLKAFDDAMNNGDQAGAQEVVRQAIGKGHNVTKAMWDVAYGQGGGQKGKQAPESGFERNVGSAIGSGQIGSVMPYLDRTEKPDMMAPPGTIPPMSKEALATMAKINEFANKATPDQLQAARNQVANSAVSDQQKKAVLAQLDQHLQQSKAIQGAVIHSTFERVQPQIQAIQSKMMADPRAKLPQSSAERQKWAKDQTDLTLQAIKDTCRQDGVKIEDYLAHVRELNSSPNQP